MAWGDEGPTPVYNPDGTIFGYIDQQTSGPGLAGDYHQPPEDDDRARSIWDDDQDDNPASDYKYRKPPRVPVRQAPAWSAPSSGDSPWQAPGDREGSRMPRFHHDDDVQVDNPKRAFTTKKRWWGKEEYYDMQGRVIK